ncbi:MAG: YaiI/YqxD family protein [Alphaproteobacteria bacterium]|nr:YaiI/YqxD family protein [Alphaproteobacteria bacterium]
MTIRIFVDADACPVKEEVYRVAERHKVPVTLVSNSYLRVPASRLIDQVVVEKGPDAADDHIAGLADPHAIVVTADIPLADRCLRAGSVVIGPNGKPFTVDSIGSALATRALMEDLRSTGDIIGGPPPFQKRDRSRFLEALHEAVMQLRRG